MVGINDPKLRERLLRETDLMLGKAIKFCRITEQSKDLTLEKAIKFCRITEQSKEQWKIFISPTPQTGNIDAIKRGVPPVDTE